MSDEERIIRDSKLTPRFEWNSRDGVTFNANSEVLATYTLQLIGPRLPVVAGGYYIGAPFLRYLSETEENLTDLLPAGFRVEIKEWDE